MELWEGQKVLCSRERVVEAGVEPGVGGGSRLRGGGAQTVGSRPH